MKAQGAFGALLCLWILSESVCGQSCDSGKPVCVEAVREPYYQEQCSNEVLCARIDVPCGTVENRFFCNFDEICVKHQKNCLNATLEEEPLECLPSYTCEWKPYHEIDREMFSVRCTEYYTLLDNQSCGDAMAKFFLPWKVFSGFNPDIDCETAGAGDRVCVHAFVEAKRQLCGNGRCKIGERCLHTGCSWKPKYGDQCGSIRCPPGYACSNRGDGACKSTDEDGDVTYGALYFYLPIVGNSTSTDTDFRSGTTTFSSSSSSTSSSSSSSSTSTTTRSSSSSTTTISISTSTSSSSSSASSSSTSTRIETSITTG